MRKKFLLAACTAAALTLAGCGGATSGTAAPAPVAPAPVAQITTIDELSDAITKSTQGKNSATMTTDMNLGGQSITGEGAYSVTGSDVKMQMTMTVGQLGQMEIRLVNRVMYMKNAQFGPKWFKAPIDPNNPRTAEYAKLIEQVDVSKQFGQFKTIGTLKGKAEEPVDGQPATRYDIAVDVANAPASAPSPQAKAQIEQLKQAGVQNIDMQLWIDKASLPLQFKTTVTAKGQPLTATVKLKNWGAPVAVTAPPADQTTDLPN
jgi:hypothetical protein